MTANKLKLNTDKTELLIIHSRFRLLPPPRPPPPRIPFIRVETDIFKLKNEVRNFGVVFDNTLTMSFHINNIVKGSF